MSRRFTIFSAICLSLLAGCGGDEKVDAIETLWGQFSAAMLTGQQTLDASLFDGTTTPDQRQNPLAYPQASARTLTLGAKADDGTSGMEVTISKSFAANADGTGTVHETIVEKATGFTFLDYTATLNKPEESHSIPSWGLKSLKADGTGEAFILLTAKGSGTVSRTFTNTNPANGHTLINLGSNPAPAASASGKGSGVNQFLGGVVLSRVNGKLVAKIGQQGTQLASNTYFTRDGGPATTPMSFAFSKLTVGGAPVSTSDLIFGVGTDLPGGGAASATSTVDLAFSLGGGVTGGDGQVALSGPLASPFNPLSSPYAFSGALQGLDSLNDGTVQIDNSLGLMAFQSEAVPQLDHSISDDDALVGFTTDVWLASIAMASQTIVVAR